jgi:hypothetical protein
VAAAAGVAVREFVLNIDGRRIPVKVEVMD